MATPCKRPAPGGDSPAACGSGSKRARHEFTAAVDDYDLLGALAFGPRAVVTEARHRRTGAAVAVKAIRGDGDGGRAPAALRELACLRALRGDPSAVQLVGVGEDAATGDVFLVTELAGATLRRRLAVARAFSEAETRACMRQLLRAAERMHAAGTVHRHITPENVLVGAGGALKLCGFGMATTPASPAAAGEPRVGTLRYGSPEQLIGMGHDTPAVDVWALGCVMAELLAGGEPLFESDTADDVIEEMEYLHDELITAGLDAFDALPELSQAGREVLAGLLSFHDGERLTAAEALKHRWFEEEDAELPAVVAKAELPVLTPNECNSVSDSSSQN
ncbi:hypothetical protein ACP4OV_009179 [Aristida adscensionis]